MNSEFTEGKKPYTVKVTETYEKYVLVFAEDEDEAYNQAVEMFDREYEVMTQNEFKDFSAEIVKEAC